MIQFINKKFNEGICECELQLADQVINVEMDLETESGSDKEFAKLEALTTKMIQRYLDKQQKILERVAKEITQSAYEQSDYKPNQKDYDVLRDQLTLKNIYAFEDGVVLTFDAPIAYPNFEISVQLTRQAAVDDISLEEKN